MEIFNLDELSNIWTQWGPRIIRVALIVIVSFGIWRVVVSISQRTTERAKKRFKRRATQRTATLSRIIRSFMGFGIFTFALTLVLDEIGFKIGPILAAAGVAGVAIGFGAQSLVKDILNGFFMLLEGQIQVGDWIDAGGKVGRVEDISLRVLSLRDWGGNVHIIPHGEITSITNMTKNYSMMMVNIGVAYKEDTHHVMRVLEEVSEKFIEREDLKSMIQGEPEILGIQDFGDSSINYTVRLKVKGGEQWELARQFRRDVKDRFDEENIEIPFPHRTVYIRREDVESKVVE